MDVFVNPGALLLVVLLLPLGALIWLSWRVEQQDRSALGDSRLIGPLLRAPAGRRRLLRTALLFTALLLIIVAMARPTFGSADEKLRRKGLQVMIVLDGSRSMAVEDVYPNRFDAAKNLILQLFDDLDGSQFGMVIFGRTSYVQFPLTSDLEAARNLVAPLSVDTINSPGSNIAVALEDALRSFVPGQTSGRVILLISDGGDPEQDDPPGSAVQAARKVAAAGIQIHTIGVGTPSGGRIPYDDQSGMRSYMQDDSGREVVSRLNEQLLGQIASVSGGSYFRASNLSLNSLAAALERGAPVDLTDQRFRAREDRFQLVILAALLLLVFEYLLLGRREA
ncbi:MAG: hypothetical protein KatS3mg057_2035 [Herpetosiphonaceae bacterium]|nr:MAG: hypothetical protein KatS3mg057_2035 [Herpetosiphonaceae bacterium]